RERDEELAPARVWPVERQADDTTRVMPAAHLVTQRVAGAARSVPLASPSCATKPGTTRCHADPSKYPRSANLRKEFTVIGASAPNKATVMVPRSVSMARRGPP